MVKGNLVFFCGAGGTGKTQLAEALCKELKFERFKSPTRDFYRQQSVENEQELFNRPEEFKRQFQKDLYAFYLQRIKDYTATAVDSTVFERSPFCNLGYLLYHNPSLTLKEVTDYYDLAVKSLLDTCLHDFVPMVVLFPYPTSWILEGKNKDNFRHIAGAKDTMVHALMQYFCWKAWGEKEVGLIQLSEDTTENWVEEVRNNLFSFTLSKV